MQILLKHLNDHYSAAVVASYHQSFQIVALLGGSSGLGAVQVVSWNWAGIIRGRSLFSVASLHAEPSRSNSSSGWRGRASSGHLWSSVRKTQSRVATRDGVRFMAPPHSIEFSWREGRIQTNGGGVQNEWGVFH